jgi:hypothetical protein
MSGVIEEIDKAVMAKTGVATPLVRYPGVFVVAKGDRFETKEEPFCVTVELGCLLKVQRVLPDRYFRGQNEECVGVRHRLEADMRHALKRALFSDVMLFLDQMRQIAFKHYDRDMLAAVDAFSHRIERVNAS